MIAQGRRGILSALAGVLAVVLAFPTLSSTQSAQSPSEDPAPAGVAFFAVVDLVVALYHERYDVALYMAQERISQDLNESVHFLDVLLEANSEIQAAVLRFQRERYCEFAARGSAGEDLFAAMDEFAEWRRELYERTFAQTQARLPQHMRDALGRWIVSKQKSMVYQPRTSEETWGHKDSSPLLERWLQRLCE